MPARMYTTNMPTGLYDMPEICEEKTSSHAAVTSETESSHTLGQFDNTHCRPLDIRVPIFIVGIISYFMQKNYLHLLNLLISGNLFQSIYVHTLTCLDLLHEQMIDNDAVI